MARHHNDPSIAAIVDRLSAVDPDFRALGSQRLESLVRSIMLLAPDKTLPASRLVTPRQAQSVFGVSESEFYERVGAATPEIKMISTTTGSFYRLGDLRRVF